MRKSVKFLVIFLFKFIWGEAFKFVVRPESIIEFDIVCDYISHTFDAFEFVNIGTLCSEILEERFCHSIIVRIPRS